MLGFLEVGVHASYWSKKVADQEVRASYTCGARAAVLAAREVYDAMGSVLFVAKADAFLIALEA